MNADIISLNDIQYVRLGDVVKTLRYLTTKSHENDDKETHDAYAKALLDVANTLLETELTVEEVNTPEKQKKFMIELSCEYYLNRYLVSMKDANTGERIYFRKFCGEDGDTPAFTNDTFLAKTFTDHYLATSLVDHLAQFYNLKCRVTRAALADPIGSKAAERLYKAIFGEDENDG